jgi:hypothetical protein
MWNASAEAPEVVVSRWIVLSGPGFARSGWFAGSLGSAVGLSLVVGGPLSAAQGGGSASAAL